MKNIDYLKKKVLYCSERRGTKEMDLLLGNFVKKYIDSLNEEDLKDLDEIICIGDEVIHKWYFENKESALMSNNKVTKLLKDFSP